MKTTVSVQGIVGFALAAAFALARDWSLPAFCWSTWLAGLVYAWTCIGAAALQIVVTAWSRRDAYERRLPLLERVPSPAVQLGATVVGALAAWVAFRISTFVFAFYGLFLSVFAEMQPVELFGRDGFINSDFFTPVTYLVRHFWPMAAGVLIASWADFLRGDPWRRVLLPFQREVLRMHVMVLALPFVALAAWALLGEAYHSLAIVVLMGLFYLFADRPSGAGAALESHRDDGPAAESATQRTSE